MIVQIEPNIYNTDKYFDILDQMVHIFQSGKHIWDIKYPNILQDSKWLKIEEVGKRQKKRIDDLIKTSVRGLYIGKKQKEAKITLKITQGTESELVYQPNKALLMMQDAVHIIVENSNSDRIFIETIAKAYGEEEILNAIRYEWLKFDTEGGKGGIPRRIEFHFQKSFKPRLFILLDSDREFPNDTHKMIKLESFINQKNIKTYHILKKRAIENYIPSETFNSNDEKVKAIIQTYIQLSEEQKDYFDLKKGFKNKGKLPDSQLELFNRIDGKNIIFKTLRNGFKISGFKPNDLYLFFNSDKVTQKTLENRCSNDELEDILSKISSLI